MCRVAGAKCTQMQRILVSVCVCLVEWKCAWLVSKGCTQCCSLFLLVGLRLLLWPIKIGSTYPRHTCLKLLLSKWFVLHTIYNFTDSLSHLNLHFNYVDYFVCGQFFMSHIFCHMRNFTCHKLCIMFYGQ